MLLINMILLVGLLLLLLLLLLVLWRWLLLLLWLVVVVKVLARRSHNSELQLFSYRVVSPLPGGALAAILLSSLCELLSLPLQYQHESISLGSALFCCNRSLFKGMDQEHHVCLLCLQLLVLLVGPLRSALRLEEHLGHCELDYLSQIA